MMKKNSGFSIVETFLILVIVGILGGTGWFVYNSHKKANETLTNANTVATAPVSKPNPYAGWKEYCSSVETSCFKYPSNWTAKQSNTPNPNNHDGLVITSPAGTKLTWLSEISGIGGACDPSVDSHVYIHEVNAIPNAKGLYEVSFGDKNSVQGKGIISDVNGNTPTLGDSGLCKLYLIFKSKNSSREVEFATGVQWNFQEFKSVDADVVKNILLSYKY